MQIKESTYFNTWLTCLKQHWYHHPWKYSGILSVSQKTLAVHALVEVFRNVRITQGFVTLKCTYCFHLYCLVKYLCSVAEWNYGNCTFDLCCANSCQYTISYWCKFMNLIRNVTYTSIPDKRHKLERKSKWCEYSQIKSSDDAHARSCIANNK